MKKTSIIIPTTCETKRTSMLLRAIKSVLCLELEGLDLYIVVNGERYDDAFLTKLYEDNRLNVIYLKKGNVSIARLEGIKQSSGDYFGFLDDDDELLPGALEEKILKMENDTNIDVAVTNGYIFGTEDELLVNNDLVEEIEKDQGVSFLISNWFASAAPLFRRKTIELELFEMDLKYFEWTYLFFRLLAKNKNISFINIAGYRIHEDHDLGVSNSVEYELATPAFLRRLLELSLPSNIKNRIKIKYQTSLNVTSNYYLRQGDIRLAFLTHLRCLINGGWRYLPYSRVFIHPAVWNT